MSQTHELNAIRGISLVVDGNEITLHEFSSSSQTVVAGEIESDLSLTPREFQHQLKEFEAFRKSVDRDFSPPAMGMLELDVMEISRTEQGELKGELTMAGVESKFLFTPGEDIVISARPALEVAWSQWSFWMRWIRYYENMRLYF